VWYLIIWNISCCAQECKRLTESYWMVSFFFKFRGLGRDRVRLVRRPLIGLFYQPRMVDECRAFGKIDRVDLYVVCKYYLFVVVIKCVWCPSYINKCLCLDTVWLLLVHFVLNSVATYLAPTQEDPPLLTMRKGASFPNIQMLKPRITGLVRAGSNLLLCYAGWKT
jgi:hypothetical protein